MLKFLKSKWWDEYCDWCYRLRNDWVDNLVSKEYKENFAEISGNIYINLVTTNIYHIFWVYNLRLLQALCLSLSLFIINDIIFSLHSSSTTVSFFFHHQRLVGFLFSLYRKLSIYNVIFPNSLYFVGSNCPWSWIKIIPFIMFCLMEWLVWWFWSDWVMDMQ
jgi:hypothetical protein